MADNGPVIDRWGKVSRQGHQIFADKLVQFAAEVDEPAYGRTGVADGSLRRRRQARHQDGVR